MQTWKLCDKDGSPRTKDGVPHLVERATRGEAKHEFKKTYGQKPESKRSGHKLHTTRKRLPIGLRVRLVNY